MNPKRNAGGKARFERQAGVALLLWYLLQAGVKLHDGVAVELLWLSNAALLLAALGLLWNRVSLVAVALLWVGVPHTLWIADWVGLAATGQSRLGIVSYWPTANLAVRLGTAYHLVLLPVLVWVVAHRGVALRRWVPLAAGAFLLLAASGRLLSSPAANVNYAFRVALRDDTLGLVAAFNAQPDATYLLALGLVMACAAFLPTAMAVDTLTATLRRTRRSPRVHAGAQPA